jgi:hypothetical protein
MTVAGLTILIATACFKPIYSSEEKKICVEVVANCAIVGAGEVSQNYEDCLTKYEMETK